MNIIYGYCRVSTESQSIERQVRNIRGRYPDIPDRFLFREKFTGTTVERPQWKRLMAMVREGDTILFDSVSRMSRSADEGWECYRSLFERGVKLEFIKEPHVNTETYRETLRRQVDIRVESGCQATDEFIRAITEAVNAYLLGIAETQIRLAFEQAEKEVLDLHERTREGIETARRDGKQIGQKPGAKLVVKKAMEAKEIIRCRSRDFSGELTDAECIRLCGISRNSYYKYKSELKQE